jgi:hypothetical protein
MLLPSQKLKRNQRRGSHRFRTAEDKHRKNPSTTMEERTPIPTPSKPSTSFQRPKRWKTHTKQRKEETITTRKINSHRHT